MLNNHLIMKNFIVCSDGEFIEMNGDIEDSFRGWNGVHRGSIQEGCGSGMVLSCRHKCYMLCHVW